MRTDELSLEGDAIRGATGTPETGMVSDAALRESQAVRKVRIEPPHLISLSLCRSDTSTYPALSGTYQIRIAYTILAPHHAITYRTRTENPRRATIALASSRYSESEALGIISRLGVTDSLGTTPG